MIAALLAWLATLIATGGAAWWLWRRGHVLSAVMLGHLALFTQLRPPVLLLGLDLPLQVWAPEAVWPMMQGASLAILVWLAAFCAAHVALRGLAMPALVLLPPARGPGTGPVFVAVLAALAAIGLGGTAFFVAGQGGLAEFTVAVKAHKSFAGTYAIRRAAVLAALLAVYGLIVALRGGRRGTAALYAGVIGLSLAANFAWGNRMNIALIGLVATVAIHLCVRPIRPWEALALFAGALGGLQGLRLIRDAGVAEVLAHQTRALDGMSAWRGLALSLHLSQYDALMLALRDAGTVFDWRGGRDFLNGLVSWIPRFVWADKPETYHVGGWFRRLYEYDRVNGWPMTPIGAWYVNFGWIGVAAGGLASGLMGVALRLRFRAVGRDPWQTVIGAGAVLFLMDGGVNTGLVPHVVLYTVPLTLLVWAARLRAPGLMHGQAA